MMKREMGRKQMCAAVILASLAAAPVKLRAQASEIPSAAPAHEAGQTPDQRGRELLDLMVDALGGKSWLNRGTMYEEGRTASFYRGAPTGSVIPFVEYKRMADATSPELARVEFLAVRGMIAPGMKRDVVHIWSADNGWEMTFKGKTALPKEQVADYLRRRSHTIDEVVRTWIHAPGVMVVAEGTTMVERRMADKVTVLSANNDAVTIELDSSTHLPLRRTFEWRNEQFKDHDEDTETYDDYHVMNGVDTAFNVTRYRNGDMADQTFLTKVKYGQVMDAALFDPEQALKKK